MGSIGDLMDDGQPNASFKGKNSYPSDFF